MNLLRALATVSSMTLLSRILGFVRDLAIARVFGAGLVTARSSSPSDRICCAACCGGAFSQAFVPSSGEFKDRRGTRPGISWIRAGTLAGALSWRRLGVWRRRHIY
jgi:putative peptidoglycan lipid II flippase